MHHPSTASSRQRPEKRVPRGYSSPGYFFCRMAVIDILCARVRSSDHISQRATSLRMASQLGSQLLLTLSPLASGFLSRSACARSSVVATPCRNASNCPLSSTKSRSDECMSSQMKKPPLAILGHTSESVICCWLSAWLPSSTKRSKGPTPAMAARSAGRLAWSASFNMTRSPCLLIQWSLFFHEAQVMSMPSSCAFGKYCCHIFTDAPSRTPTSATHLAECRIRSRN
mmetsp:Transcript_11181/g.22601  ORF Transcript_11181/g.22601 Transcript_11181/m.22601 type:complete len:228 (-) Transcript_11181:383-1066(-)